MENLLHSGHAARGRAFFLSGVVGDPAHLVSFLFHSQFFPCAVGDPPERFLFSGEKEGFRHLYSAVLSCAASRSARFGRRSGACGDFFSGASCAAACSATGFSPGGAFSRQTSVPRIPLDLGMFLLRRGKDRAQAIGGNFSPSCHIFSGDFSFCLVLGAFLRGETFCRKIRPAVFPAWAEFSREPNASAGIICRISAFPCRGVTRNLGKSPSLRPCSTGRAFFLSGAVSDPAHLVSFLFHS